MQELDFNKSVYDLTQQYPELIEILKDLGFLGVRNEITRNTVGRITTIPQGCEKMGIDVTKVINTLQTKGFEVKA